MTPASLEDAHLVRSLKQAKASFLVCLQLAELLELCQAQKRHTDPKKASCLIPGFLTSLKSTIGGAGRICQGVGHR